MPGEHATKLAIGAQKTCDDSDVAASPIIDSQLVALAYGILIYAASFAIAWLMVRRGEPRELTNVTHARVGSLDGLRGILALGVFVHHSVTSYVWMTTGVWNWGPNHVLNQFGQSTVGLFFMITAFLFTTKTMRPMSWSDFYRSRLARLLPLYAALMLIVLAIVLTTTGQLTDAGTAISEKLWMWLSFFFFVRPDPHSFTWALVGGVNWTLKYEVLFYVFAVPLLYFLNRTLARWFALTVVMVIFVGILLIDQYTGHASDSLTFTKQFMVGILIAYLYSIPIVRKAMETKIVGLIGIAAACMLGWWFIALNNERVLIADMLIFGAIVGNTGGGS